MANEFLQTKVDEKGVADIMKNTALINPYTNEEIENWLFEEVEELDKFVCLIIGTDGTAKSPLALSYLTDEDIKEGKKVVVIDLDGGCIPLVNKYHKQRCIDLGRKASEVFIVKNPLSEIITETSVEIDYKATFNRIKGVVKLLKNPKFRKEHNIKYIIFDGLSTLLKHAEHQMRLDKNIAPDGGIQLRYWLIRNKIFIETVEAIKSLPISSFFIAHEDFLLNKDGDNSSVKEKVNALVHQKIHTTRSKKGSITRFHAEILKSKYNIKREGKQLVFGEVNGDGEYTFTPEEVLKEMI